MSTPFSIFLYTSNGVDKINKIGYTHEFIENFINRQQKEHPVNRLCFVFATVLILTACKGKTDNDAGATAPATTTWVRNVPASTQFAKLMRDSIPQSEWQTQRDLFKVSTNALTSATDERWLFALDTFLWDFKRRVLQDPDDNKETFSYVLKAWENQQGLADKGWILEPWHLEQLVLDADIMEQTYDDRYRRSGTPSGFDYYPQPHEVPAATAIDPLLHSATYAYPMTRVIAEANVGLPSGDNRAVAMHAMGYQSFAIATYNPRGTSPRTGKTIRGLVLYTPNVVVNSFYRHDFDRFVVVHETGHGVDDQILIAPTGGLLFEYDPNDPSNAFYRISWHDDHTPLRNDEIGFVSMYAMTNHFEDFAEHYAYYKEEPTQFREWITKDWSLLKATTDAAKVAAPLYRKYALMYVRYKKEFGATDPEITQLLSSFPLPTWTPPPPDGTMSSLTLGKAQTQSSVPVCGLTKPMPRR